MAWHIDPVGLFYDPGENTVVYFDPASGDTHLVSQFAAHLIRCLASANRPLDTDQIAELIRPEIEQDDQSSLTQTISDILDELTVLDIVASA